MNFTPFLISKLKSKDNEIIQLEEEFEINDTEKIKKYYTSDQFKESKRAIKISHGIISILLLIITCVYFPIMTKKEETQKLSLSLHYSQIISLKGPYQFDTLNIGNFFLIDCQIWIIVVVYLALSFILNLLPIFIELNSDNIETASNTLLSDYREKQYNGGNDDHFARVLFYGYDWISWLHEAIVGSIVLWIIAQVAGVNDVIILVSLIIIHIGAVFAGSYAHELINSEMTSYDLFLSKFNIFTNTEPNNKKKLSNVINWWPFVFGRIIPSIVIIGVIITHFILLLKNSDSVFKSWFYYTYVIVLLVLFAYLNIFNIILFYAFILPSNMKNINDSIKQSKENLTKTSIPKNFEEEEPTSIEKLKEYFKNNTNRIKNKDSEKLKGFTLREREMFIFYTKILESEERIITYNMYYEITKIIVSGLIPILSTIFLTIFINIQ